MLDALNNLSNLLKNNISSAFNNPLGYNSINNQNFLSPETNYNNQKFVQPQYNEDYFSNLMQKTFSPLNNINQDSSLLDNAGNVLDTAFNVLDIPSQMIGDGLDFAWDNTLGALTNTQDMFTGDDLKIIPEIASMVIPGLGAARGAKFLKNLYNVGKYEKAMASPFKNSRQNVLNSLNGFIADYGKQTGLDRAKHRIELDTPFELVPEYKKGYSGPNKSTKKDSYYLKRKYEPSDISNWFSNSGGAEEAYDSIVNASRKSPVPLYRGGNDVDGWFYTPDRSVAKKYGTRKQEKNRGFGWNPNSDKSVFRQAIEGLLDTDEHNGIIKLPKGTKAAPGIYYSKTSKREPFREVFVTPAQARIQTKGKYESKNRTKKRVEAEEKSRKR